MNDLSEVLKAIVEQTGEETFNNPEKLNGVMADLAPELKRDRKIIVRMAEAGIISNFLGEDMPKAIAITKHYLGFEKCGHFPNNMKYADADWMMKKL